MVCSFSINVLDSRLSQNAGSDVGVGVATFEACCLLCGFAAAVLWGAYAILLPYSFGGGRFRTGIITPGSAAMIHIEAAILE